MSNAVTSRKVEHSGNNIVNSDAVLVRGYLRFEPGA